MQQDLPSWRLQQQVILLIMIIALNMCRNLCLHSTFTLNSCHYYTVATTRRALQQNSGNIVCCLPLLANTTRPRDCVSTTVDRGVNKNVSRGHDYWWCETTASVYALYRSIKSAEHNETTIFSQPCRLNTTIFTKIETTAYLPTRI